MLDTKNIFRFWAKLPHEKNSPKEFHPLICHMLDVAAATSEIWQQTLSANARLSVAKAFGLNLDQTKVWIMFLAALHDLGKASPAFQLRPEAKHLIEMLNMGKCCTVKASEIPHGRVTAKELPDILKQELNLNKKLARQLSTIIGGHHGSFPTSNELIQQYPTEGAGKTPWKKVREEFVKLLISFFKLNEITLSDEVTKIDHGVSMIIAGLVSVADWVGSNSDFFPYQVDDYEKVNEITFDISVYLQTAQNQAQKALKQLGWLGWSQSTKTASFEQIFPKLEQRRPLQDAVIELAAKVSSPSIVIVEAPMGEGKTEAALYLADNWGIAPGPRGFYIALPTQATSNQMFSRTKQFLKDRYSDQQQVHLQLLHGHASLSAEFKLMLDKGHKIFQLNGIHSDDDKNCCTYEEMNVIAAEWFTHRKRGLLAPFGVGTVDQALLAVLQTRHVFVRLFGLSHKTIIIDEVHAYDAYMSQLLERLLEWFAVMGSPVVLLSATLPKSRRAALLAAYYRGLHLTDSLPDTSKLTQSYPCISWASSAEINGQTIAVSEQISRTLKINWVNGQLPNEQNKNFELGENLKQALETGGCAAVICNTVARAQQVYTALKTYFADNELYLFHARYFFKDRYARERQALEIFGKDQETNAVLNTNRPFRAVLVATQVVEQSLDLDFDLMVTDIAPVDLILQRSGRLHRHLRERPTKLSTPTLWICRPENSANVPEFDVTGLIYDKHILLRTWLSLNNLDKVQIPNDIENLIESAYNPELACPTTLSDKLQKAWQTTLAEQKKELQRNEALAEGVIIPEPQDEDNILDKCYQNLKEDKPEIHPTFQALTRLSEPSVSVVLLMPNQYQEHNLEEAPNLEQTKYFLEYSASLQQRGLVQKLLAQEVPKGWQKSTLLRNHRLIKLDSLGRWQDTENKHEIILDLELGIVVNNLKYTKSRS